ncbi:MAG: GH92 family glycosyl hydrolase, partial [Mangrovibacterium sp.]|nr:GH92 family glycosyl hydrolase [Mangrovibacterium sp.]
MHSSIKTVITVLYCFTFTAGSAQSPAGFVNPFIGTDNYGNMHPGATLPWGMVSVCPFNVTEKTVEFDGKGVKTSSYVYNNGPITGFSHVNLSGVGCADHGVIGFMPAKGNIRDIHRDHSSRYSDETAKAGYYSVYLDDYRIRTEVTATLRTGLSRYTFSEGLNHILLDLGAGLTNQKGACIEIVSEDEVAGFCTVGNFCNGHKGNRLVYFVAKFSRKADEHGIWNNNFLYRNYKRKSVGDQVGAYLSFDTRQGETILVKTGISWVSIENARENLEAEQTGFDFDAVLQQATGSWNKELSKIKVTGGTREDQTKFYTALYHCLLHPNILQDVNGQHPAMNSEKILQTCSNRYTVFSLWDTYRNLHPLLTLVYPERQTEMVRSMLDMYRENGWLP